MWLQVLKSILLFQSELPKLDIETPVINVKKDSPQVWTGIYPWIQIIPNPGLLVSFGSLWRKGKFVKEGIKDHDENEEATKMDDNKEALNTEKMFLE